ncbi:MAG: pyruvate flavodoxin/ferredoxin oxidoreductase [Proteobacteria bacterium]|nr:pyruvate flavodoxin/ferredoxin oxidoreductase [Pseudomonadota bacterium]
MAREFLEGNEAIAAAAIKANCDFFAGYPITPASSILHYMLNLVPGIGGTAIQAEDEIASMGFCIAAAMAGKKVMTATSGPGMSLYSENIGLAQMGETPMVIINIQRQGPATGSATKGAEGDILFTRWITSGGMPLIALSPATVGEAYELTYRAFNLSEQYRTPVVLQASKEVGVTREAVDLDAIELPPLVERKKTDPNNPLQHNFNEPSEVPGMLEFTGEKVARYTTSTHGKNAYLSSDPVVIQEMIDHYIAKIDDAADDMALYKTDYQDGADTLLISYGIISRSAKVALEEARAAGKKVSSLTVQSLYPVPETAIKSAMKGMKKVIVPEMNMGQYLLEIQRMAPDNVEVVGVNKMDTYLVSPTEIMEKGGLK